MTFARGYPKPANSGRKKGARNKRTLAAAARPDALAHLEKIMTSTDGTITPDLKLRAAIALAQYQYPKPVPTYVAVDGYEEPKTVEEARTTPPGNAQPSPSVRRSMRMRPVDVALRMQPAACTGSSWSNSLNS